MLFRSQHAGGKWTVHVIKDGLAWCADQRDVLEFIPGGTVASGPGEDEVAAMFTMVASAEGAPESLGGS